MAKEKPLDVTAVQTWLSAWEENDVYSDAAIRQLLSLIPDNDCIVVITRGVGCPLRRLVFRRWRRVEVIPPTPTIQARMQRVAPDRIAMFEGPNPPMAPIADQLWLQVNVAPRKRSLGPWATQRIFRWDGTQWLLHGYLKDEAWISIQGTQECSFAEALTWAQVLAKANRCQTICTFDDSTRGNA